MSKSTQDLVNQFVADFEKQRKAKRDKMISAFKERRASLGQIDTPEPEVEANDDFSRGISRGIDQTQALGYGSLSLIGDAIGAESLQKWGLEGYERNMQEADKNKARVGRIEDIEGLGDAIDWGQGILGELVPTIGAMALGGGVGGAIAKKAAQRGIAKAMTKEMAKKAAIKGQTAGAVATSIGMETGEIYGDVASKGHTGAGAIVPSLAGGALAGALDSVLPLRVARAMGFAGGLKKEITGTLRERIKKEGLKGLGTEAGTEFLQTAIEEGTKSFITKEGLPDEIGSMLLNSVAAGALGGGVMGGTAAISRGLGTIEEASNKIDRPVPEGMNPVTKEDFGTTSIAKYGKQLADLDKKIKEGGNPELVKQAATIIDELEFNYLQKEVDKDGKPVKKKPLETKEAEDLVNFYGKDYKGKNAVEIGDVAPETNAQREARLKDEADAKAGKAALDKDQEAALDQADEIAAEEAAEESQQKAQRKQVEENITEDLKTNAEKIVEDTPDYLRRQAGDTEETLKQSEPGQVGPFQQTEDGIPEFLKNREGLPLPNGPTYEPDTPATGTMHTLRNLDDAQSVLDNGLAPGSNVGGPGSQALGNGGVTFEYDPKDVDASDKGYNENEAVVATQKAAKPVRILIDRSDVPGLKDAVEGGDSEFIALENAVTEVLPAGKEVDDQFWGDIGGYLQAIDDGSNREQALELNKIKELWGSEVKDIVKEHGEALNAQSNNPDGVAGFTAEDYIKQTADKLPKDIPIYSYEVDENGKPINIRPERAAVQVPSETSPAAPDTNVVEKNPEVIEQVSKKATKRRPEPIEKAESREVEKLVVEKNKEQYDQLVVDGLQSLILDKTTTRENLDEFLMGFSERTDIDYTKDADALIDRAIQQIAAGTPQAKPKPKAKAEATQVEPLATDATIDEIFAKGVTVKQLRDWARFAKVKGFSKMKKEDLKAMARARSDSSIPFLNGAQQIAEERKADIKGTVTAKKAERKSKLQEVRRKQEERADQRKLEGDDPFAAEADAIRNTAEKLAALRAQTAEEKSATEPKEVPDDETGLTPKEQIALENSRFEKEALKGLDEGDVDYDDYGVDLDNFPDDDTSSWSAKGREQASKRVQKVKFIAGNYTEDGRFLDRKDHPKYIEYSNHIKRMRKVFDQMISKFSNFKADNVEFVFLTDMSLLRERTGFVYVKGADGKVTRKNWKEIKRANPAMLHWKGLFSPAATKDEQNIIYMNPAMFYDRELNTTVGSFPTPMDVELDFKWTMLHEIVGHYGLRRLFDVNEGYQSAIAKNQRNKWEVFLDKVRDTNPQVLSEALMLRHQWSNIDLLQDFGFTGVRTYKDARGESVQITDTALRQLIEEYIAERAGEFSDPALRAKWTKSVSTLMKRITAWFKHKLGKYIGMDNAKVTDDDIMGLIAQSHNNLFGKGLTTPSTNTGVALSEKFKSRVERFGRGKASRSMGQTLEQDIKEDTRRGREITNFYQPTPEGYNEAVDNGDMPPLNAEEEHIKALKQAQADGVDVTDILATEAVQSTGYGRLRQHALAQLGSQYYQKFRQAFPGVVNFWVARGTLRNYDMKNAQAMTALGKMGNYFKVAKDAHTTLKNLNAAQGEAVMEYMTNDRADINNVNLPEPTKRKLMKYKETMMDFGEKLVQLDLLDPETYYKNKGKYLPARYLAHAGRATGAGRKASPLHYLMRQKDLSDTERTMLGELVDPQFIIPEAISLIGRDVALLEYMETIRVLDKEGNLGWILGDKSIERYNPDKKGMPTEISVTRAEEMMETWREIVLDYEAGGNTNHQSTQADINEIKDAMKFTQQQLDLWNQRLEKQIRELANIPLDQPIPDKDFSDLVGDRYKKMPKDRGYGALGGKWVRKEIYDEFTETSWFQDDLVGITKALGPGGVVDRGNQLWKTMKVPFNLPSWLRNSVGNFVLMDIATSTNSGKLIKIFSDEVLRAMNGDPSVYFREAHKRGLFGTTFSSNEIFLLSEQHNVARRAKLAAEMKKTNSDVKSAFLKGWGAFVQASEIASQGYGNLEGIFKTASMRDFVERWQKQNNVKSLDDLTPEQREAVLNESVIHANKAVFDYSELTAWQKDLRRSAFGAPFITYTMKALPAVVRGMAQNPQKFIKYLALPYAFAAMSMAGMGDVTPEELEEWSKKQPDWMKQKSSVHVLPFKDGNGKLVPMDFGYWFPWAPWQDVAMKTMKGFEDKQTPMELALATKDAVWNGANDLGLLGGPVPTTLAALLTGKETFLGRDIVSPGDSASVAVSKQLNWLYTLMAPPFLTNQGVAGKLMDHFDVSMLGLPNQNVDVFGNQKATLASTLGRGVGVSTYPTSLDEARLKHAKSFRRKLKELQTAKRKAQQNQGWSLEKRVQEIKDINRRIILLKKNISNE